MPNVEIMNPFNVQLNNGLPEWHGCGQLPRQKGRCCVGGVSIRSYREQCFLKVSESALKLELAPIPRIMNSNGHPIP